MRNPVWNLCVDAAQRGRRVALELGPDRRIVGVPVLPVASDHVTLTDGRIVRLGSVAVAQVLPDELERDPAEEPFG